MIDKMPTKKKSAKQRRQSKASTIFRSIRSKMSVALIIFAALLIELTTLIGFWFGRKSVQEEVQHRAKTELHIKNMEIQMVLNAVEVAASNMVWAVEGCLEYPDSIYLIVQQLVKQNPNIVGAAIAFTADYYPQKGRWFEPYIAQHEGDSLSYSQIGSETHDYLNASWYVNGMAAGKGLWSEPYFDDAGAQMMLTSYTLPVHDKEGKVVGLLGADVSIDWLTNLVNARHIYPSSFNVMISRQGQLLACPVESLIMRRSIQEVTAGMKDTMVRNVNREMMAGNSGQATITDDNGEKNLIFYAKVDGDTGWSMAVVCSDREIYGNLRQISILMQLLMFFGMALMAFIIWRTIKGAKRMEAIKSQKKAFENELHIASDIQTSMLPKKFPPFPDRTDVDVHAIQKPAKEVGGDIYDFYIRDEKLFFCIGDVSGKGMPASLVMAVTHALFRNISAHEAHPNRIVSAINNTLTEDNPDSIFVTFFVGVLDLPTGRLRYCNAGHESPVLLTSTIKRSIPCDSNLPLGVMSNWEFSQQEMRLDTGSTLFLFTDGLTEAMNPEDALFGKQRMMDALTVETPRKIIDNMTTSVTEFVEDASQNDDLTMMAVLYSYKGRSVDYSSSITLPNDVQTTPQLANFVDEICNALCLSSKDNMQINLAVEEAVVNVMNYAYPKGTVGEVKIDAVANEERLKFTISDQGMPFDPTAQSEADTTLSAEERPIGGLGIHLVRHYMDSINYERIEDPTRPGFGKNVLTLRKKLKK